MEVVQEVMQEVHHSPWRCIRNKHTTSSPPQGNNGGTGPAPGRYFFGGGGGGGAGAVGTKGYPNGNGGGTGGPGSFIADSAFLGPTAQWFTASSYILLVEVVVHQPGFHRWSKGRWWWRGLNQEATEDGTGTAKHRW